MQTKPMPAPTQWEEPPEQTGQPHRILMEERRRLTLTGVTRVLSCDESGALLRTAQGDLSIGGQEIQVSELSVRTGEVHISGKIEFLQYTENRESGGGFWNRLMR